MANLLLTGFEPYGGYEGNPSAEIACALNGEIFAGTRVAAHILPVVFEGIAQRLDTLFDDTAPRAVICLGLDPGEWAVRLENIAVNVLDFEIADNGGQTLRGSVDQGGADSLVSTLPLDAIEARLAQSGIPVRRSDDAGRYLCNAVMYLALSATARINPPPRCGFIHLPFLPEQAGDKASLPLDTMVEAIRIAIAATLEAG